ncbi:MAG: DUF2142 domain-containing protein [Chloroflexota bacterium]|nr:DUF2142 domain-containing protein [Chloroflexota bacterium]
MKRTSPIVLLTLLLIVIIKVAAQPLTTVVAIGVLLITIGVMIYALIRRFPHDARERSHIIPVRLNVIPWLIVGALAIVIPFIMLATQPQLRATYTPDQFATAHAIASQRGFYSIETDPAGNRYVWTQERATLLFDFLVYRPITITVEMRSAAVAGGPDEPVAILVNGRDVGDVRPDPKNAAFQSIRLTFVPYNWGGQQSEIKLLPQRTFKPSNVDTRTLGTMVRSITIDKSRAWSPIGRRLWLVWALPLFAALALGLAGVARRNRASLVGYGAITACLLGMGCAAGLLFLLLFRIGFIEPRTYLVWSLGSASVGACFAVAALALPLGQPDRASLFLLARHWIARSPLSRRVAWIETPTLPFPRPAADEPPATRRVIVRDLLALFVLALGIRCLWVVAVPPWQAPDEPDQFTYVSHLVEQQRLPYASYPNYPEYSEENTTSWGLTLLGGLSSLGSSAPHNLPYLPIAYDYQAARAYRGAGTDRWSFAAGRATPYPPLYYLYSAPAYLLFKAAPILSRLFAVRFASAVLGALSCVFGYLIAYELRRTRRWGWSLGLCMALLPMYVFITSVVDNDVAMDLGATALIWLTVRAWQQREFSPRLALALGITSGLTLLTKPTVVPVVIVAGIVVLIKVLPALRSSWRSAQTKLLAFGAYAASAIVVYSPWAFLQYRYYGGVIGLGSIPFTPFVRFLIGGTTVGAAALQPSGAAAHLSPAPPSIATISFLRYIQYEKSRGWMHFYALLIKDFWGNFGWLDAPLPDRAFIPILIVYVIGGIGLLVQFVRQSRRRGIILLLLAFIVAQSLFLFVGVNYLRGYANTGVEFGLQGRYFFPIIAPLLFLLLSGWDHLCAEHPIALRLAPVAMAALQLVALATLFFRYYGVEIG